MKWLANLLFIFCIFSQSGFAHGEDNIGPHGGFIKMPGIFHTEVMPKKNGFAIMLLDINFEHPTVKDSSVKAYLIRGEIKTKLPCKRQSNFFLCLAPHKLMLQKGILQLETKRTKNVGAPVSYDLPLSTTINNK